MEKSYNIESMENYKESEFQLVSFWIFQKDFSLKIMHRLFACGKTVRIANAWLKVTNSTR